MAQTITTKYQEFNTSSIQNRRYVNVMPAGIYTGYVLSVNPGIPNVLDISAGKDEVSTLVTNEGIVITETASVSSAVKLAPADPSYTRYDLIIAEYQYSTNPSAKQIYKVIKGANQLNIGTEAIKPVPSNTYQIPLAYIKVRAGAQYIVATDINPVPRAGWVDSNTWGNLRPEIVFTNNTLLYVYPGIFPNAEGTSILTFAGGYSAPITDTTFVDGTERWYLFGLTDDLTVAVIGYAAAKADLPQISSDVFVLARVRAKKINNRIEFLTLEDMRMPFTRAGFTPNEDLKYQELLATSVFQFLRVENFETLDGVIPDITTNGEIYLDSANKSLVIEGTAASEVTFVTNDMLVGSSISLVEQFMLVSDSTIQNLQFDYSVVSALSGFTGKRYLVGELVKVPSVFASRLYIKFYVPSAEFAASPDTRMYSYGILINLDKAALNIFSVTELGIKDLTNSINNLINNGDFYYWSKNTINDKRADLRTQGELVFPISTDSPQTADGWQFTNINSSFDSDSVKRVFIGENVNRTTALQLSMGNANSGKTDPTVLEYRIPRAFELSGRKVSFAIDYSGINTPGAVTMGIAQFKRTDAGLELIQQDENVIRSFSGTSQVTTAASISVNASVVSFYLKFNANTTVTATLWHARAAIGEFPILPYSYVGDASDNLRSYYERGTFYLATYAQSGSIIGNSAQFGSPKHLELGTVVTRTVQSATADRSSNISGVTYTSDRDSITVSATSSASSSVIIQTEWEAFVQYEGSVI